MSNEEQIDYMIQCLTLAKQEIAYAKKYEKERKNDDRFYWCGHYGYNRHEPNGTIIRESLKMVGRLANRVANNVSLSAYNKEVFKE